MDFQRETKDFRMDLKSIDDNGQFTGFAAVYGNVDLGKDIIEPGAFTKTLAEKNGEVPLLWQHNSDEGDIGSGKLVDSSEGLKIHGQLFTAENPYAARAYGLMKRGGLKGLSIGYDVVNKEQKGDIRHLKELRLWEVSTVTFPMNPLARISTVKSVADFEKMLEDLIDFTDSTRPLSAEREALIEKAVTKLSALRAAKAPEAAMHDNIAPEILHAKLDGISKFLRGEL